MENSIPVLFFPVEKLRGGDSVVAIKMRESTNILNKILQVVVMMFVHICRKILYGFDLSYRYKLLNKLQVNGRFLRNFYKIVNNNSITVEYLWSFKLFFWYNPLTNFFVSKFQFLNNHDKNLLNL